MPFVAVNCGAIPHELAASMFFGHTKGAFTGADSDKGSCFDAAKGGTLFLDEIGTLPFDMQSSLLRVLQEGIFMPVGSTMERIVDVRIVAATNENMEKVIAEGRFREDLFHRLNEFEICQPALSECPEDILPLANFFREKYSLELHRKRTGFTAEAERLLISYPWSGQYQGIAEQSKTGGIDGERYAHRQCRFEHCTGKACINSGGAVTASEGRGAGEAEHHPGLAVVWRKQV